MGNCLVKINMCQDPPKPKGLIHRDYPIYLSGTMYLSQSVKAAHKYVKTSCFGSLNTNNNGFVITTVTWTLKFKMW